MSSYRRRLLNLVVDSPTKGYSLHRINPSKWLFYDSPEEAAAAAEVGKKKFTKTLGRLPDPIATFDPSTIGTLGPGLEWFELFSPVRSEGKIVNSNKAGHTAMFDADSNHFLTLPNLYEPKGTNPVAVSVTPPGRADAEDSLYVMDRYPGRDPRSCLEYKTMACGRGWKWRHLPSPPVVHNMPDSFIPSYATTTTVEGCCSICISISSSSSRFDKAGNLGTYCFDTARRDTTKHGGWAPGDEWRHVGDWALPFQGRAHYIPEVKLWLGFRSAQESPYYLCAADLSAVDDHGQQPAVQQVWEDLSLPEEEEMWVRHLNLINLGGGRLCIAKGLYAEDDHQFAVPHAGRDRAAGRATLASATPRHEPAREAVAFRIHHEEVPGENARDEGAPGITADAVGSGLVAPLRVAFAP